MKKKLSYILICFLLIFCIALGGCEYFADYIENLRNQPQTEEQGNTGEGTGEAGGNTGNETGETGEGSGTGEGGEEGGGSTDQSVTFTFVSLNDVHGYIEQEDGENGLSNTAYAIDKLSSTSGNDDKMMGYNDDIVLFANGDMFQGTAISNLTQGRAVLDAMNVMGFVGMGIGNHEFDWGLDVVTAYFDGDKTNGEANFPLLACNVCYKENGNCISDDSATDYIESSTIIEKQGVKIGLISAIGPCEDSILASRVANYTFQDVVTSVGTEANKLKKQGAELISVNLHYGNSGSPLSYEDNQAIAKLKDADGNYLVDVIFNGHTHSRQCAKISRTGGTSVPVLQGGGYNSAYCYATLTYNKETKKVTLGRYDYDFVSNVGTNYIKSVQDVVDSYRNILNTSIAPLATSAVTISYKGVFYNYTADIMLKAFDTDFSMGNTGGIRGTGGIEANSVITKENIYEVIPFDNIVVVCDIKGSALMELATSSYYYYGEADGLSIENLNDDTYYSLAVIDYVFDSTYFDEARENCINIERTTLILRDLLVADITLYGQADIKWNPSLGARIGKQSW